MSSETRQHNLCVVEINEHHKAEMGSSLFPLHTKSLSQAS